MSTRTWLNWKINSTNFQNTSWGGELSWVRPLSALFSLVLDGATSDWQVSSLWLRAGYFFSELECPHTEIRTLLISQECCLYHLPSHTKHLGPYLTHSRISVNADSHCLLRGVRVTASPSVSCPLCKVYLAGLSAFLLGEMKNGSNSKTKLLKKRWLLLLLTAPAPSPSRWN